MAVLTIRTNEPEGFGNITVHAVNMQAYESV